MIILINIKFFNLFTIFLSFQKIYSIKIFYIDFWKLYELLFWFFLSTWIENFLLLLIFIQILNIEKYLLAIVEFFNFYYFSLPTHTDLLPMKCHHQLEIFILLYFISKIKKFKYLRFFGLTGEKDPPIWVIMIKIRAIGSIIRYHHR